MFDMVAFDFMPLWMAYFFQSPEILSEHGAEFRQLPTTLACISALSL